MSSVPSCFPTLLAAWNEYDPAKLRSLVEASLTEDIAFTDPNYQIVGIDAFIAQVNEFRAEEGVKVRLVPTSGVDLHHDRARYSWAVVRPDGSRFEGFDAVALDLKQGKICRIDGFFGPLPPVIGA
ncbi:nuclear transport factor 2 family protein [Sphingopyxis sp.]|uniref:nuclear transport factor 2 family protein n=1 Tax=Sphingopyxis sp. TaxID=1908224 RepID=UPI002E12E614